MQKFHIPILMFAIFFGCYCCQMAAAGANADNDNAREQHQNTLLSDVDVENRNGNGDLSNYDKRVERYAFGLGRRAYTYTAGGNGIKRLPIYNFGLGKRARPYSFGLGKRADYEDEQYGDGDYERSAYGVRYLDEKRNRPYSFGLGKRGDLVDDMERRNYPIRYGFGLGRR